MTEKKPYVLKAFLKMSEMFYRKRFRGTFYSISLLFQKGPFQTLINCSTPTFIHVF